MQDLLRQLRNVKLQLIVVVLVAVGVGLVALGYFWGAGSTSPSLLALLAVNFGFAFLTTGGVSLVWEFVLRKANDRLAKASLDEALRGAAPAIRDAVLDSLAFNARTLKGVASDEMLDGIAANALALRLDDEQLAHGLYTDVRDQVINAPERWHDVKIAVSLSPWASGPATGKGSMFVATIRWEYKVRPASSTMRFACVSDEREYRDLLRDKSFTSAWYLAPEEDGLDAGSTEAYELLHFAVNGRDKKIRRTTRPGAQVYAVSLDTKEQASEVTLAYTSRILVQRRGNLLYLDLPRPTKNFRVQLDYSQADIRYVNVLDYFASSQRSHVERAPKGSAARTVNVSFDGWILPRAGVAFVWVLEDEFSTSTRHL